MFKVVAGPAAHEALAGHVILCLPLEVPQFREGVHDDTEDDVHQNSDEDDEEGDIIQVSHGIVLEVLVASWHSHVLQQNSLEYTINDSASLKKHRFAAA